MNKKIVTLIIVILVSFCFLSFVVADNVTHGDNSTTDHDKPVNKDTSDKNKTPEKNESGNKSKGNYILAQGSGDDIRFSDGFRGFRLDYSKPAASFGDEFKSVSASKAPNSKTLEQIIILCYKEGLSGIVGEIVAEFIQSGSASSKLGGGATASSYHGTVKINDHTEAVFAFEVLKSVSGNESDYFAYKVSYRTINKDNQTNLTNVTNATNITNITNMTLLFDNETNTTFLEELLGLLLFLADMLFDVWEPIIETLINDILMFINALEEIVKMYEEFMAEVQSLMDALEKFLDMLELLWKELDGLLKLFAIMLNAIQQLLNLIDSVLNFISGLISAIISLIQQILGLVFALINFILGLINQIISFIMDLINQITALIQAILDFLKSVGSFLINVIESAVIIISAFVIITIGAFVYNRIK